MKTVWMTALGHEEASASLVSSTLAGYGLACKGHFWVDAPEKMAWKEALGELLKERADVWLILANAAELAKPTVRYGLSLFAAALAAERGTAFPIMILDPGTGLVLPDRLVSATVVQSIDSIFWVTNNWGSGSKSARVRRRGPAWFSESAVKKRRSIFRRSARLENCPRKPCWSMPRRA